MTGRRRGFGAVLIIASILHLLAGVLVWLGLGTLIWSMLWGLSEVSAPTPTGAEKVQRTMTASLALVTGALATLLMGLAMDVTGVVMSVRRLRRPAPVRAAIAAGVLAPAQLPGQRPGRGAPIVHLVVVSTMVLCTALFGLGVALGASLEELRSLVGVSIVGLVVTWVLLLPVLRLAQLVVGIVRASTGDPEDPPVGVG